MSLLLSSHRRSLQQGIMILLISLYAFAASAMWISPRCSQTASSIQTFQSTRTTEEESKTNDYDKIYFDIGVKTPSNMLNVGRLWFNLNPKNHPHHLPLHTSNICSLASGRRKSVDPKATYVGCTFQFSPATIDDGSFRYRWAHQCDGHRRNAIKASLVSGGVTDWDESFSDPERVKECTHNCFGGSYYGWRYDEILAFLSEKEGGDAAAILLTVPIHGPGAGTSRFSIVRVSESPREWGERLLLNSGVVGFLDCFANGGFGDDTNDTRSSLDVLRAMAQQKIGVPTIVGCGIETVVE
jgi:hypothetical protein